MNQKSVISPERQAELHSLWEKAVQDFASKVRASGRTVTMDTQEPSDTTELQVTFPMGRRPSAKPPEGSSST